MSKSVFFIAPKIAGFHEVIIQELKRKGYEVDFLWDILMKDDPYYVRGKYFNTNTKNKNLFCDKCLKYWENILNKEEYNKPYDILFVIDGKALHQYLFQTLRKRNKKVRFINYLFDTTRSIYRFNINFKYFDKVVTFDRQDASEYGLEFLPIPWMEVQQKPNRYKLFALGTYIPSRYNLYKFVEAISNDKKFNSYIKLYYAPISFYPIKYVINLILRIKKYLPPFIYYSNVITHKFVSNEEYQEIQSSSEIIVDSIDSRQDGLTARCTWALGAEKKIITDNHSIKEYSFYTPEQIFIVEDFSESTKASLIKFIKSDFTMNEYARKEISKFRLDNWIKTMLNE